jgi:hypothetical protein
VGNLEIVLRETSVFPFSEEKKMLPKHLISVVFFGNGKGKGPY